MIELKSLKKRYVSKKGVVTDALDGIDLQLGKGLTFIVGTTGCGKSTLLNILGKLEEPDEGQVFVDGVDLKSLTVKQGDDYRNRYVGFVFQEYNLMDELTVEENVSLACKLQGHTVEKAKIDGLFERLGLRGMESKHPDELSGGQRQRVAIARALIKNPKLILADEPTGALDSKTGEEILDLLREISLEVSVVVVSHNLDYAEKYGDRIIELSDGNIVGDRKKSDEEKPEKENTDFTATGKRKKSLGVKDYFRFVRINFGHRWKRLVAMLVVSVFFLSLSGVIYTSFFFNPERVLANTWKDNGVSYVAAGNARRQIEDNAPASLVGHSNCLSAENIKELSQKAERNAYPFFKNFTDVYSKDVVESDFRFSINFGEYSNARSTFYYRNLDYLRGGMEIDENSAKELDVSVMAGRLPEKQNEIAVSDYIYDQFAYWGYRFCDENENRSNESETEKIEAPKDLLDRTILVEDKVFTITGVLNVGDKSEYDPIRKEEEPTDKIMNIVRAWMTELETSLNAILFVSPGYYDAVIRPAYEAREFAKGSRISLYPEKDADLNAPVQDLNVFAPISYLKKQDNMPEIIWKEGASADSLSDNQILVKITVDTLSLYKIDGKYFPDLFYRDGYESSKKELNFENLKPYSEQIFKDFSELYIRSYNSSFIEKSYEVVGIFCDEKSKMNEETGEWTEAQNSSVNLYFSASMYEELVDSLGLYEFTGAFVPLALNSSDYQMLRRLNKEGRYFLVDRYSEEVRNMSEVMEYVAQIGSWFALVFLFINGIMLGNYVAIMIADKCRQIGILRTLGAGKKELLGIFGTEGVLLALITAVGGSLAAVGISALANFLLKQYTSRFLLSFITIGFGEIALIFLSAVLVGFAASYFPVAKSAKMKPIDALKQD